MHEITEKLIKDMTNPSKTENTKLEKEKYVM